MPRAANDLGAGEWAVLAVLAERPTHGFAVARAMAPDGEIGRVWTMRRPLVYRAIDVLSEAGFARPTGTVASRSGPRRTVIEATPAGRDALERWLSDPVDHVRDARSLLMLKLLFITRSGRDPRRLLTRQRKQFEALEKRLTVAAETADGFDAVLVRWRLESTTAAVRFIDGLLGR
jgi:DNA-binding PadR family transcriptional regulator